MKVLERKCSKCGGIVDVTDDGFVCRYCGDVFVQTEVSEDEIILLNSANSKREDYDFDGALEDCNKILAKNPSNSEANWCALLAKYKIIYIKNSEGEYVSTFLCPQADKPIKESEYYSRLSKSRREDAERVENRRQIVLDEYKKIPNYDVFISYKQHKGGSYTAETEESEWADKVYDILLRNKLRAFIDKKSLRGNAGWEPHIYSALQSAKIMVVISSSLENINSPWVKNEWKRFIAFSKTDASKVIAVACPKSKVAPEKLPEEAMRKVQMVDVDEKGWHDEILQRAKSACGEKLISIPDLFEEAYTAIKKKKFGVAKAKFKLITERNPRNAKAYWGLLMCRYRAFDNYDIVASRKSVDKFEEFKNALEYADDTEYAEFKRVKSAQLERNTEIYPRTNYNTYRLKSKKKRIAAIIAGGLAACICCVSAALGGMWFVDKKNTEIAGEVTEQINSIGEVSLKSEDLIIRAENSYEELNNRQKKKVTNYQSLVDARAVYGTMSLISVIDKDITTESLAAIEAAETSYLTLTEQQRLKVANYSTMSAARIGVDKIFAGEVVSLIELIGKVHQDSGKAISVAEEAYARLTESQKTYVDNLQLLATAKMLFNVVTLIDSIGTVTLDSAYAIITSEIAYAALSDENKKEVINYENLVDARAVYNVMFRIDSIRSVTLNSGAEIEAAEREYARLSEIQKESVTNYGFLSDSRAAYDAAKLIEAIGEVGKDSENLIAAAEQKFNTLTASQKEKVPNSSELETARAVYNVIVLIDKIGSVNLNSALSIFVAESAYDTLTAAQRTKVSNYSELTEARTVYGVLKAIDDIGTVTGGSGQAVLEAEKVYSGLTDAQKQKIYNYALLTEARTVYNVIHAIDLIGAVTVQSEKVIIEAEKAYSELAEELKIKINNHSVLSDARAVYNVIKAIENIGTVNLQSQDLITAAEQSYERLTETQKNRVINYTLLSDAKSVYAVMSAIDCIGEVTLDSGALIAQAEEEFLQLTSLQKSKVLNRSELTDARAVFNVLQLIDDIGNVDLADGDKISKAEREYEALDEELKNKISNYTALTDARAVFNVMKLIDAIGVVKIEYENLIKAAENAYEALDTGQKNKVENYSVLVDARNAWEKMSLINITYSLNPYVSSGEALKETPSVPSVGKTVKYGSSVALDFASAGVYYTFLGWYNSAGIQITDGTGKIFIDVKGYVSDGSWCITQETTLYARWAKVSQYTDYNYISTRSELEAINNRLTGKHLLIRDIDISSRVWNAMGEFSGVFDGGFHQIKGLTMNGTYKSTVLIGFFSKVNNATVKNVSFGNVNISITSDNNRDAYTNVGTVAGSAVGGSLRVSNVRVDGSVTIVRGTTSWGSNNGSGYCGGIFGEMSGGGNIEDCVNNANITVSKGNAKAGGIVGYCGKVNILNCINTGAVTANGVTLGGFACSGGITGECTSYSASRFTGCFNSGAIACGGGSDITKSSGQICGKFSG